VRHWHASPRSAIGFIMHAATLESEVIGPRRNFNMPGLSVTVEEQVAALRTVAGPAVVTRIRREPDATIASIVSGWPQNFDAKRAMALGFTAAEKTFEDIIRIHIEDELRGTFVH
jgi:D-erythronate 2-dehydrogenase